MLRPIMLETLPDHERSAVLRLWQRAEAACRPLPEAHMQGQAPGEHTPEGTGAAERDFRRLACLLPAIADIHLRHSAVLLTYPEGTHPEAAHQQGIRAAAAALHRACILLPEQPGLHRTAAEQLWLAGMPLRAQGLLARALRIAPADSTLWLTRTRFLRAGLPGEDDTAGTAAGKALRRAVLLSPGAWRPVCQAGLDCAHRGETDTAIRWQRRAIRLAPLQELPRRALAEAVRGGLPTRPDISGGTYQDTPLCRDLLATIKYLEEHQGDHAPRGLIRTFLGLLCAEPAFRQAATLLAAPGTGRNLLKIGQLLDETGLTSLLGRELLPDPRIETFLTDLRRQLLGAWEAGEFPNGAFPENIRILTEALAGHCLLHEYSLAETGPETAALQHLRPLALQGDSPLLLLACYLPVVDINTGAPGLAGALARFRERHIDQPQRVRAAAATIERLTPLAPGLSRAVARQYEEDPYPRWTHIPAPGAGATGTNGTGAETSLRERLQTLFPDHGKAFAAVPHAPEILIAGCGTGREACALASGYPDAAITAVDLSRASLGYARCKAEEAALGNIRFAQADILALGALAPRRFDFIESVGVLHHMEDPAQALGVLAGLLAPGGVMHLGLYSRQARVAVNAARGLISGWGLAPTPAGIREARQRLLALRKTRPDLAGLFVSPDFYVRPGCRDLVFHVHEHQYDVPGLKALLKGAGLHLLGFELPADRRAGYLKLYPEDKEVRDWACIEAFEQAMPWAFSGMYRFWLMQAAPPFP